MQLSASADLDSTAWDVCVDGQWLGDGPGERPVVDLAPFDAGKLGSVRLLVVWLDNGETYSLSSLRQANAKGQDKDEITVVLPHSRSEFQVFDPRLSTEYDAAGTPRRFGLELWLGTDPDADHSPLRLGGEAHVDSPSRRRGALGVHPMWAHGADAEGLGLYLLFRT